jgi:hypothetical protein
VGVIHSDHETGEAPASARHRARGGRLRSDLPAHLLLNAWRASRATATARFRNSKSVPGRFSYYSFAHPLRQIDEILGTSGGAVFGALVPGLSAAFAFLLFRELPSTSDWIDILAVSVGVYLASGGSMPGTLPDGEQR